MIKKSIKIVVIILILSIFLSYPSIIITNNCIADKVEKKLKAYNLPSDTVLVDSISDAGKFVGSGNGMQYMGAILIASDLSEEEILLHYENQFEYIEVNEQTSPTIDFFIQNVPSFKKFDANNSKTYYCVIDWGSNRDYVNEFISNILDLDLRGH